MADETTIAPDFESMPSMIEDIGDPKEGGDPKDELLLKDSAGKKSGKYSKKIVQNIVAAAKATGVDPAQALAIALQESGLGSVTVKGRRGRYPASLAPIAVDFSEDEQKEFDSLEAKGLDPLALKLTIALRNKLDYGKRLGFLTEPEQLQAFNGYGTITPATFGGATKAYGVDISQGVNMKKNPLYGKRVQQLKNDLLSNEYIQSLLK